jgi:hypothetical protein
MSDQKCEHTFGLARFCDDHWLVTGEASFIRDACDTGADLLGDDYFKYCPDCGILLSPVIGDIKSRLQDMFKKPLVLFPNCIPVKK